LVQNQEISINLDLDNASTARPMIRDF